MTADDKLALIEGIIECCGDYFEISLDILTLCLAIIQDKAVDLEEEEEVYKMLSCEYEPDHPLWDYIHTVY